VTSSTQSLQGTTSLLHQLGGYPSEAVSKVRYVRQSKVDF
jgi:hypothetical protein